MAETLLEMLRRQVAHAERLISRAGGAYRRVAERAPRYHGTPRRAGEISRGFGEVARAHSARRAARRGQHVSRGQARPLPTLRQARGKDARYRPRQIPPLRDLRWLPVDDGDKPHRGHCSEAVERGEGGARRTEKAGKDVKSELTDTAYDALFAVTQDDMPRMWREIFPTMLAPFEHTGAFTTHRDRYRDYRNPVYRWSETGRGIRTGSRSSVASFWSKPFRCLRQERRQRHCDAQRVLQHFHTPRRTLAQRAQAEAQSRCTLVSEEPILGSLPLVGHPAASQSPRLRSDPCWQPCRVRSLRCPRTAAEFLPRPDLADGSSQSRQAAPLPTLRQG